MKVQEFLKNQQHVAYQTIYNGFKKGQTSHAYLLSGGKGMPLKETALFLAQCFLCDNPNPLACEECLTCERVKNGSYVDFMFINKDEGNINKDVIEELQDSFSRTAMEIKGIKVYIIHLIEKANTVAVNRLLKFLEEPGENIIGILTTENSAKVLPTIVSRCQVIRLKGQDKGMLIEELIKHDITMTDAKVLSLFNNTVEEVLTLLEETSYTTIKDLAYFTFKTLFTDPLSIHYYVQKEVTPNLSTRDEYVLFLNIFLIYVKELLWGKIETVIEVPFTINEVAKKSIPIDEVVKEVMLAIGRVDANVNCPLLLDQLFYRIALKGGLV